MVTASFQTLVGRKLKTERVVTQETFLRCRCWCAELVNRGAYAFHATRMEGY